MMLSRIRIHNFKTFLNAELQLDRQHLLLGKNASGKTNFARGMQFLAATASWDLNQAGMLVPGGTSEICNWFLKSDEIEMSCECSLEFDGRNHDYQYDLKLTLQRPLVPRAGAETDLRVTHERLTIDGSGFEHVVLLDNNGHEARMVHEEQVLEGKAPHMPTTPAPKNATMLSRLYDLESNRRAVQFRQYLQNWAYYSVSPLAMRRGWSTASSSHSGGLDSDGEQLSNAIFHMKNVDERRYRRLIDHVHIVEPSLQSILFIPAPDRPPVPFVEFEGKSQASWTGLSDGTLRALALGLIIELSSAFSPPNRPIPSLAIIEEPENGIFPGQLRRLFDKFEEWAPSSQFIFTSHSPYFIDMFDNKRDSVTIFRRARDRSEIVEPWPAEPLEAKDSLTLSMEYASELFE